MNTHVNSARRSKRFGTYTLVIGALLLAILILVNAIVLFLPDRFSQFDLSQTGMTEISEKTEKFLEDLEEDVTIYWLCENESTDLSIEMLLGRYEQAGDHVNVEIIDPLADPTFTKKYSDTPLPNYTFIVESARRHEILFYHDMSYYTNGFVDQNLNQGKPFPLNVQQFDQLLQQYGAYMNQYPTYVYFRGEAFLTASIDYVTQAAIPHAYMVTGHGEPELPAAAQSLFKTLHVEIGTVNLSEAGAVPENANQLLLFAPKTDLTEAEAAMILDYLNKGGSVVLVSAPENVESCPRLMSIGAAFGLTAEKGVVADRDAAHSDKAAADILLPDINSRHPATSFVTAGGMKARMPHAHAIAIAEKLPERVQAVPLFTTSKSAERLAIDDASNAIGAMGSYHVAASAVKPVVNAAGAQDASTFTWFGSAEAFTDKANEASGKGNFYYLAAALGWTDQHYTSPYANLPAVSINPQPLNVTPASAAMWGVLLILIVPVGVLVTGLVVWYKRRKR